MTGEQQTAMLGVYEGHLEATKRTNEYGNVIYDETGARHACIRWARDTLGQDVTLDAVFTHIQAARQSALGGSKLGIDRSVPEDCMTIGFAPAKAKDIKGLVPKSPGRKK